jgi:HD-like signal output (HDOD) protein
MPSSRQPSLPPPPSLDEVCAQALKLPCAPSLLPRLIAALHDDESTAAEIERIIAWDSALAAATLRLANSAHYGGHEPIGALDEAILRLGQREIYRLAALILVSRWESAQTGSLRWSPGDYSRHSICTALAAEVLAEATERIDPSIAYTAGLVCDLGKLALAYVCAPFYATITECCELAPCTWEQAEKSVLGYHNAETGARLLRAWRFPELFALAVEHQLNPLQTPAEALPLVAHLHAAKYLAVALGPGVTEEGFLFTLHGSFLAEWGFTTDFLEEAMIEVRSRALARLGGQLMLGPVG